MGERAILFQQFIDGRKEEAKRRQTSGTPRQLHCRGKPIQQLFFLWARCAPSKKKIIAEMEEGCIQLWNKWVMGRRPLCRLHISFRKRSLPSFQFSCPFISCCPSEECSLELSFFKDKWRELNVIEWDELTGVKSITAEGNPRNHWWNQWVKGQSTIHFIQLIQFQRNSIN